jgi:hypothetical protein
VLAKLPSLVGCCPDLKSQPDVGNRSSKRRDNVMLSRLAPLAAASISIGKFVQLGTCTDFR